MRMCELGLTACKDGQTQDHGQNPLNPWATHITYVSRERANTDQLFGQRCILNRAFIAFR